MNIVTSDVSRSVGDVKPAIWHPVIDFLLVGGASIIGGFILIACFSDNQEWVEQFNRDSESGSYHDISKFWLFSLLALVINLPHQMASYRLLYRSKVQIAKFRWSAIYVPCILLILCIGTAISVETPVDTSHGVEKQFKSVLDSNSGLTTYIFAGLSVIHVVYLGWHFNLQGWRMTATFAHLNGIEFSSREQRLIKSGFLAMIFTHAVLFLAWTPLKDLAVFKGLFPLLILGIPVVGGIALVLGGLGFYGVYQRTGRRIPINAMTPWAASFFWYYFVTQYHYVWGIAIVVHVAHALQYLSFTNRIERNLQLARNPKASVLKSVFLMLFFILCGYMVFIVPKAVIEINNWSLHLLVAVELLVIALNIHHFFVDDQIWKTSNLEMRRTLLAHIREW
ncbi:MAG: hypothetical protein HN617_13935 [Planctomycetaceae bacterium]|jgi:hypothetical protein|nr:hypothetical protein [Planctomycetaceae bacterium]MBT4725512.1 hypothetical protein [Planctomycetaceae bacterium]MBT4845987.1 hypothetical protein [Planctomycetaceae bacterium]MBT5125514.1 hypothetical protein [Planctomycetaceae bacterium]MBT5599764.1 hypothetical protein [Planctomycetaceae bacterium]